MKFTLDYADAPPDAPRSLVGKFPSPEIDSFNTGVMLGNYIREVNFYKHLAPTALISTPKVWFTDVDPATSEFVLMMEDLAPAEQGAQLKHCTVEQARLAVAPILLSAVHGCCRWHSRPEVARRKGP